MSPVTLSSRRRLAGFFMLEMLFCLALLALVLTQMAKMHGLQWQNLQRDRQSRQQQAQAELDAHLQSLTRALPLFSEKPSSATQYPDCGFCQGQDFSQWYQHMRVVMSADPSQHAGATE